jgi:hypothetical protein
MASRDKHRHKSRHRTHAIKPQNRPQVPIAVPVAAGESPASIATPTDSAGTQRVQTAGAGVEL